MIFLIDKGKKLFNYKIVNCNDIKFCYVYINFKYIKYTKYIIKLLLYILYNKECFVILSNNLENINILNKNYIVLEKEYTVQYNYLKYLDNTNITSKVLLLNNKEIDNKILYNLIEKFKVIDVFNITPNIINTNYEFGTNITCISNHNIVKYDVYINLDNIDLSNYIINNKAKYINFYNPEDIYSKWYKYYLKFNIECINFNKNLIGKAVYMYCRRRKL